MCKEYKSMLHRLLIERILLLAEYCLLFTCNCTLSYAGLIIKLAFETESNFSSWLY